MLSNKLIAVVVPAFNEESQIKKVIYGIPKFVDYIIVVNDASTDKTEKVVLDLIKKDNRGKSSYLSKIDGNYPSVKNNNNIYQYASRVVENIYRNEGGMLTPNKEVSSKSSRIILINHLRNASVGGAIATGYKWCRDNKIDCTAVMGGDGQMDPDELYNICKPIIDEEVDYVKANRLKHRSAYLIIPKIRFFGNSVLSLLTKIASGYWRISDTQAGYTAISLAALKSIRIHKIYKSYGCPNDILVKLNIAYCSIKEIESKPVYNIGEKSKMNELKVVPKISWLLFKLFWSRLYIKYLFRDFHPLFLLYNLAFLILVIDAPIVFITVRALLPQYKLPLQYLLIFIFLTISGLQLLFFAMWMDMQDNDRLQK